LQSLKFFFFKSIKFLFIIKNYKKMHTESNIQSEWSKFNLNSQLIQALELNKFQ